MASAEHSHDLIQRLPFESDVQTSLPSMTAKPSTAETADEQIQLTIHHHGKPFRISLPSHSKLSDLSSFIATELCIPSPKQKFIITPKLGLLKPPFPTDYPLSSLTEKKIVLMGSTATEIATLSQSISAATTPRRTAGPIPAAKPSRARNWQKEMGESKYTFHTLRPLPYLPHPERSLRFLERLRDDAGIKASMLKHKFSIPLLTEMNPAEHTTHESRTLGLNRNKGEVIELRLRTDAFDGYRDYKTMRKTLCHELAHCVFGEHDRDFWDLTALIEREVEKADWTRGGRSVGEEEFYNPHDGGAGEHMDYGGWTGGEYVLGGGSTAAAGENRGLSRRDVLAKAAEARLKRSGDEDSAGGQHDGGTESA